MRKLGCCLIISVFLIFTIFLIPADAHRPLFTDGDNSSRAKAVRIIDPTVSWAIYNELKHQRQVDYYLFEGTEGTKLFLQMAIPQRPGLAKFKPTIALIGPGLPVPERKLPCKLEPTEGAIIIAPKDELIGFFEPFTQTRYYIRQTSRIILPASGTYYVVVYSAAGQTGRYTLAVGEEEVWGLTDILKFPLIWFKVRWWYDPWQTLMILGLIIGGTIGLAYLVRQAMFRLQTCLQKRKARNAKDSDENNDENNDEQAP